jgi:hypothetical protein
MGKPQDFKPGQSGNPNGRPKREWTWAGVIQDAVEQQEEDGTPIKSSVARSLVREAKRGNVMAIKELMNRMDGMPLQPNADIPEDQLDQYLHIYKPEKNVQ